MSEQVVLIEPQCRGFEHAQFNAPLLQTVLLAYPQAQAAFLGEREHIEWVRAALLQASPQDAQRVTWQVIDIPPADIVGWGRFGGERRGCRQALRLASSAGARFLIFCSISGTGLLALKSLLFRMRAPMPILVVPHSLLASAASRQPRRPWDWLRSFRQALLLRRPGRLRYIALGESILRCLQEALPQAAGYFVSLDHPYFWPDIQPDRADSSLVRFGYFGVSGGKGFDAFVRLASAVRDKYPSAEFDLVGFLSTPADRREYADKLPGASSALLSPEEYRRRALSLTYAVWTARPERYRLAASASFLDALAYGKPGIYLRNHYLEYYFDRMGDIGYLCNSYEEMYDLILSILAEFPAERYRAQRETILRGRHIFAPATLAPQLRAIVSALEGRP